MLPFERRYEGYEESDYLELDVREEEGKNAIDNCKKKLFKNSAMIIKENMPFWSNLKDVDEIYVLGHSCSSVDFEYFHCIRGLVSDSCEWYFSAYNDEARRNIEQLVYALKISRWEYYNL